MSKYLVEARGDGTHSVRGENAHSEGFICYNSSESAAKWVARALEMYDKLVVELMEEFMEKTTDMSLVNAWTELVTENELTVDEQHMIMEELRERLCKG